MRSAKRVGLSATTTFLVAVGLVVGGAQLPAVAVDVPSTSTPAPTAAPTPAADTSTDASTDATAPAEPTPAPTASETPAPAETPVATPAPTETTDPAAAADPALAEMNEARNHAMGSTFALDPSSAQQSTARSLAPAAAGFPPGVQGLDVSGWQTNINWSQVWADGARFAYVKATEDTNYKSSQFAQQYNGSAAVGMIRGAYHFATPNTSSGAAQARWFVQNGGGWSADGRTLPPLLDIEFNPYGGSNTCWGLSTGQMVSWIADFLNTVSSLTGRTPAIYTNTNWWKLCTGNYGGFGTSPLFIAYYPNNVATGAGPLPAGWGAFTFWQFRAGNAPFPGDQDVFNGSIDELRQLALGSRLAGQDAFGTSAALSATFAPGVPVAYIASGYNYPDALAGGAAAGKNKGPILLIQPYSVPSVIGTELKRLRPLRIVVLGGVNSITPSAMTSLQAYTSGSVTRVAGADRFDTSAALSAATFATGPAVAYIATGLNFPDALTGASVAAGVRNGPLLLTTNSSIPGSVAAELSRLKPKTIVVLGGATAINNSVVAKLKAYTAGIVTRLAGSDRYETGQAVSRANFAPGVRVVYVAVGSNFPDALSGAPVAGAAGGPVLLTLSSGIPAPTVTEIKRLAPKKIVILGGVNAVSGAVAAQLQGYVKK